MTQRLTVLHTNDLHANYDEWLRQAAVLQSRKAELEAAGETVLVVDAGDHLDMSINECYATEGRMHAEMLREAGYHAITMGNNELLRSKPEQIRQLSLNTPVPFLLCNLMEADGSPIGGCRKGS
jgi:2',3'-cyclic-nucleotide 2'-phosphodiesterase (5'-nucleotidase family)